jgi:cobalt-zinc-cadmium efflux system membrane fusion protein
VSEKQHSASFISRKILRYGAAAGAVLILGLAGPIPRGLAGASAADAPVLVRNGETVQIPEGSPLRERIAVAVVAVQAVQSRLELPGLVEADPTRTAAVLTPVSGRLIALKVSLGDRVAAGQVVALLDSPDLAQAYDDDDKAADALALADKHLRRQDEQFKLGTVSAQDLDQARSDRAQALAESTRTRSRLRVLGAPPGPAGGPRLLAIRAPVAGSITGITVAPGNMINDPTQPMMTVADLSSVWVTAQVAEKDVAMVTPGLAAKITLEAYPGKAWEGKVGMISDVLEPDTRRNKIRITLRNPERALKPNMFATVSLAGGTQSQVVLPTSALLMNNDRTSVFVETAPWTFQRKTVDTALEEDSSVAIRSGLNGGERVVVKGGILLND